MAGRSSSPTGVPIRALSPSYAADLTAAVRADGGTVEPWIVDGAEHTQAIVVEPAEYERRLDAFFEAALGGG